jgi:hypothetical protein
MKDEVLKKIKNEDLEKYYYSFTEQTGLSIIFERLTNRVRAENFYRDNTSDFVIRLAQNWREVRARREGQLSLRGQPVSQVYHEVSP